MSKFSQKMQELKRVVRLHANWLVYATLGKSALSKAEIEELEKYGKLPMDKSLELSDKSYLLGRLRALLKTKQYKEVSYEEVEEIKLKLSPIEELVLEQARLKAGQALKGLAQEITAGVYDALASSLGQTVTEAVVKQVIANEVQLALLHKKSVQQLASELAAKLQSTSKRDWRMIAQTELHRAKVAGQAQAIVNKVDIYAHSDGPDSKVSIIPSPTCCADCSEHYLDASGKPKIFTLSDLIAAGSNAAPGVKHSKTKGIHIHWKTTLPPLHPNCGCRLVYVPPGYGWSAGKLELLNKSLFEASLVKAASGVRGGGFSGTAAPKGPPRSEAPSASVGMPSVPGVAAPGNVAGPGRPPGSGTSTVKTSTGGGQLQYSPCPFGGGTECIANGGNGATEHKTNGSVMKKHQEAMARGAQPKTEFAKEQQKQQFENQAKQFNAQKHPEQKILDHLSSGEIGSVKVLGEEDHKGVSDAYKITIVGNGSGCMKAPQKFSNLVYDGMFPADGGASIPKESTHKSEVGAYQLSKALGLNHVPVTTLRNHDGSKGINVNGPSSVQHWQDGYIPVDVEYPGTSFIDAIPDEHREKVLGQVREIACMDIVMNNNDRHMGNLVTNEDLSDIKAIDHGLSFGAGMAGHKNAMHMALHNRTSQGLQVPDHLMTRFKNQSLSQTMESLDGLTTWQKAQTHLRMKYLAHIQETHGHVPIEVTRYAATTAQSYDPYSDSLSHDFFLEKGQIPYRAVNTPGWSRDSAERDQQIKDAMKNWEMPDQLFSRFVKSYVNGELGEIPADEKELFQKLKPAYKTGTGHELGDEGPAFEEEHSKFWDSIPPYAPMSHWPKASERMEPVRTPPVISQDVKTVVAKPESTSQKPTSVPQDDAPKTVAAKPRNKAPKFEDVPKTVKLGKSLYLSNPSASFPLTGE